MYHIFSKEHEGVVSSTILALLLLLLVRGEGLSGLVETVMSGNDVLLSGEIDIPDDDAFFLLLALVVTVADG